MRRDPVGKILPLAGPASSAAGTRRLGARWAPVWIGLAGVGALAALRLAVAWRWPLPFCLLRKLTGVPCPACGCTRSLLAWTDLDPARAFSFNPLFSLGCLLGAGWLLVRVSDRWTGRGWAIGVAESVQRLPLRRLVIALVVSNWVYLWFTLPKQP